ncbi:GTP-binding protein [Candidatus Woesearchaeota archaeon]|nr:GTP-binding protein [Candidatus Woesearchaeota archaeon]
MNNRIASLPQENRENLRVVIVGHVDHGKSTFIGRLLYDTNSLPDEKIQELKTIAEALGKDIEFSYIMDHLQEERDQGITIDTAQIFFNTIKRHYTIIDAPGHVEFLKNMITGASQADAAILLVDVAEGIQEQTRRHAYLLSMLGFHHIVVLLNKMDLVHYQQEVFDALVSSLGVFLAPLHMHAQYIPFSAKNGDNLAVLSPNMPWYKGKTVLDALDALPLQKDLRQSPLRFLVQDIYNFDKRIYVGVVGSGSLNKGDKVVILPSGEKTCIASLEEWNRSITTAEAGKCPGFITTTKVFIDRGNVIVKEHETHPIITKNFTAHLFWLESKPFVTGERLMFRCGTQQTLCDVTVKKTIDSSTLALIAESPDEIKNREVAEVVITTSQPVIIENFHNVPELGRFVLERNDTCAGGIIIANGDSV